MRSGTGLMVLSVSLRRAGATLGQGVETVGGLLPVVGSGHVISGATVDNQTDSPSTQWMPDVLVTD